MGKQYRQDEEYRHILRDKDVNPSSPNPGWFAGSGEGKADNGGDILSDSLHEIKNKIPRATGFANKQRKNTKHHLRHAREMGYKNQDEYERAGVDFFNGAEGELYYSKKRMNYLRYDPTSGRLATTSRDGVLQTYDTYTQKKFKSKEVQDDCIRIK